MNFLYHHYVRWQRYHALEMPNRRVGFGWMHECGEKGGMARCAAPPSPPSHPPLTPQTAAVSGLVVASPREFGPTALIV